MSLNTYIQEINDQVKLLRQDVLDLQRENRELKTHTHVAVDDVLRHRIRLHVGRDRHDC